MVESKNSIINKPMKIMIICVIGLFGSIFLYKTFINFMIARSLAAREQIFTVSAMKAGSLPWQHRKKYFGSIRAVQGVNVTTELAGLVDSIHFRSGDIVKKGDLLVQLNINAEVAQLHALEASLSLAKITLTRDKAQYAIQGVSKAILDTDMANHQKLMAQVQQQQAIIDKKTIRAPFSGRMGITTLNQGQYLNTGDTIAPLQQLNPVYEDFNVPQQDLPYFIVGQSARLSVDAYQNQIFQGRINAINPVVDINTRNLLVEATAENPKYQLLPGMFASVTIDIGKPKRYITLPQTAINYNPYGNVVFILKTAEKDKQGHQRYIATQRFVITGETLGNQIAITQGLKAGEMVVTTGGAKLSNDSKVIINNTVVPNNSSTPKVGEG